MIVLNNIFRGALYAEDSPKAKLNAFNKFKDHVDSDDSRLYYAENEVIQSCIVANPDGLVTKLKESSLEVKGFKWFESRENAQEEIDKVLKNPNKNLSPTEKANYLQLLESVQTSPAGKTDLANGVINGTYNSNANFYIPDITFK